MTTQEKILLTALRMQGATPTEIARATGISLNTIKSYIQRHKELPVNKICLCCGKELTPTLGKRVKKFCDDKCRMKYWNSHLDKVKRYAYYKTYCRNCGKEIITYGNNHRKYCSRECYFKSKENI